MNNCPNNIWNHCNGCVCQRAAGPAQPAPVPVSWGSYDGSPAIPAAKPKPGSEGRTTRFERRELEAALSRLGASKFTKTREPRYYLNGSWTKHIFGLELVRSRDGRVLSATLDGEPISVEDAEAYITTPNARPPYLTCVKGQELGVHGVNPQAVSRLRYGVAGVIENRSDDW